MAEIIRHCPDCGWDRSFAQHHVVPGWCPEAPDGHCPEWFCTACGTALLIGAAPVASDSPELFGIRDRVA
jgi:hypothetical protein